ncbi:MAG: hypothetical protein CM15mP49_36360 [Actinomycetota bacterium]|nr:MAG: hypothetical protein CM15mP49_36360 [Actinomycetota bacterium]
MNPVHLMDLFVRIKDERSVGYSFLAGLDLEDVSQMTWG